MTANSITLTDYLVTLRQSIPYVHPAGRATIDDWLDQMAASANHNDAANFAKLAKRVTDKVQRELDWQGQRN
jgi:hypothetical protein